jgi:flavodoxin
MKAAVIYYSLEGNMEFIAQKLGENGNADLCRLIPKKEYPKGKISKYVWGGKSATFGEMPAIEDININLEEYDTLVIGTPIWAGTMTPPVLTFLHDNKIIDKKIILVTTCGGGGSEKAVEKMKEFLSGSNVIDAINFVNPLQNQNEEFQNKIEKIKELMI